jgi:hypothetical protein
MTVSRLSYEPPASPSGYILIEDENFDVLDRHTLLHVKTTSQDVTLNFKAETVTPRIIEIIVEGTNNCIYNSTTGNIFSQQLSPGYYRFLRQSNNTLINLYN